MYDILIAGGGIAGCAAAYIGAKLGLNVLLVEKNTYLGGLATGGLVVPVMKSAHNNLNTEFYEDLIYFSKKYNAQITYKDSNTGWFNPELLKIVLDDMLLSVGCKILFSSEIIDIKKENDVFTGQILEKTLSLPFEAKYIIDGTGNGTLCEKFNCEFWDDTDQKQPDSLRFLISNVDCKKFAEFIVEIDKNEDVTNSITIDGEYHFTTAYTFDKNKTWALEPYFKKAIVDGVLKYEDTDYFQIFTVAHMPNTVAFNCPRLKGELGYSASIIEGRCAIYRLHNFCKYYLKGFESSFISNISTMVGNRESRRVKCEYDFKIDDIISPKAFDNKVLYSDYPIDIHSNKNDGSTLRAVQQYSFPLESLMVKGIEGLFVVGKCLGADFKSQASLRVQMSCMSMGEGVSRYIKSIL